jgi:hypothetical protein
MESMLIFIETKEHLYILHVNRYGSAGLPGEDKKLFACYITFRGALSSRSFRLVSCSAVNNSALEAGEGKEPGNGVIAFLCLSF